MKLSLDQLTQVNGGEIFERLAIRKSDDKWCIVFDGFRTYSWLCFEDEASAKAHLYQTFDALVLSEEVGMDIRIIYDIISDAANK